MMKKHLSFIFILVSALSFGQSFQTVNQRLKKVFDKINYWSNYKANDEKVSAYDSLELANKKFKELLLNYTKTFPQTLSYDFKDLIADGLIVSTSEDGLFRIYSWNTWAGGSMHYFKNVFQFKSGSRIFSKTIDSKNDGDAGCFYYQVNDVVSENKTFYITQSRAVLSSGLSYHSVKMFSIENESLNDTARLIKTKTGIKNQLGYEVDLTAFANAGKNVLSYIIEYDKINKIISIPVILDNSKITAKRIYYQFNGLCFEKK